MGGGARGGGQTEVAVSYVWWELIKNSGRESASRSGLSYGEWGTWPERGAASVLKK